MRNHAESVIIGAGLAVGAELGSRAITLERDIRPGGLVKSVKCSGGY
jgi:hypothetical protein